MSISNFLSSIRNTVQPTTPEDLNDRKFGTFGGVFTPDVLTILGVMMYLRLGWMVGNAGLVGAIAIIMMAKTVTLCTGLSMASITTNIRIGPGGAFSIISKSLGLEAGGSVGIPFYISLTLSAALYIVGFTEGWIYIFPGHSPLVVSSIIWFILLVISFVSARFAIRIQYFIMVIIALSLLSIFFTPSAPNPELNLIGQFEDATFWEVFAVFFPAVTGIMAGANMSGELKDPRRAIPVGTLSAIGVTWIIYAGMAALAATYIAPNELRMNQMAFVDNAVWGPIVLAGILAATFSSALGSMVGAPRVLQALAEQKTIPAAKFLSDTAKNKEPRTALIVTGICVELAILFGNLNALATLITMFFLITYGLLNAVVFVQQYMSIISFRPTFKVPRVVPLIGALGCLGIMFLINPVFSIVAMVIIISLYLWLARKELDPEGGDIRGGILLALAERASQLAAKFPRNQVSWKPYLLIPIDDPKIWSGSLLLIRSITYPSGSIFAFTVQEKPDRETPKYLEELLAPLGSEKIMVNSTVIEDRTFLEGARLVIQTLTGEIHHPNTLFLTVSENPSNDDIIEQLFKHARRYHMGMILLYQHPRVAFGIQDDVNLWLRVGSPNWHMALLIALQIQLNWNGKLNVISIAPSAQERSRVQNFFDYLNDNARLPSVTEFHILVGTFKETLDKAPRADVNIFGLASEISFEFMRDVPQHIRTSCLFIADSGQESALA